jgi:uncharacterized protein YccT (UPF0319 family)
MKTILLTSMLLVSTFGIELKNEVVYTLPKHKMSEEIEESAYEREIREVLEEEEIEPYVIELLVAQSKHESGNYKNNLTKYNNIFARHYFKADTFAISAGAKAEGHSRFAIYPSVKAATLSQLWYFKRKHYSFNWKSTYQFALELKSKHYYEAPIPVYVNALNKFMRKDLKN